MNTMTLEAQKNQLIRRIMETDNVDILNKIENVFRRNIKTVSTNSFPPYTLEEINVRIAESEADESAGREYTSEQAHQFLEQKHPWLCK